MNIKILKTEFNPLADGILYLGRPEGAKQGFVLGWAPRGSDNLVKAFRYASLGQASRRFEKLAAEGPFDYPEFSEDRHQQDVYDWEDRHVLPGTCGISRQEARRIIREVCHDCGIKPPRLVWKPDGGTSVYDGDDNVIELRDPRRATLLHELAHAYVEQMFQMDSLGYFPNHGPAFVMTAIGFYSRYEGLEKDALIQSAKEAGILEANDDMCRQATFAPVFEAA